MTEIKLFFPSLDKEGLIIPKEKRLMVKERLTENLISLFGGLTIIPNCLGFWENSERETKRETVDIFIIETETITETQREALRSLAYDLILRELNQSSVLITISNSESELIGDS